MSFLLLLQHHKFNGLKQHKFTGNSLVAQWLGLRTFTALVGELRSQRKLRGQTKPNQTKTKNTTQIITL